MASAEVREELNCSICLEVYRDPVTLNCGHSFCQVCIDGVLDKQEASGVHSCPQCREKVPDRSALCKNITLCNIAKLFLSAQGAAEETGISCTYCDSSVPAVKTCLLCEASLCTKHLKKHSMSPEHTLVDPTTSLENRKCSVHKKILEYYCAEDSTCICVTCCLAGEHRGHKVEPMDDAAEKKKVKLRTVLEEVTSMTEEVERNIETFQRHKKEVQRKLTGETGRIAALFRDLRQQMDGLEKRVVSEITRQGEQISSSVSDLIQQLEVKKDDLSMKMLYVERLCNSTDSITILGHQESEMIHRCNPEEAEHRDTGKDGDLLRHVGDLDRNVISLTLHAGLTDVVSRFKKDIHLEEAADLLLDRKTVSNFIQIEDDLKRARYTKSKTYPESPERFEDCQVLSTRSFKSGQHFWVVETSKTGNWMMGVAYANIERKGERSYLGNNDKSWCLCKATTKKYSAIHDGKAVQLADKSSCQRLAICLDCKSGRLSFYELAETVRHLHTFSAAFSQPLHAAFYIWDEWFRVRS